MERKLASIQKIRNILPIEGADAIEVAVVNSWKVVVKKGEFKVGDLCVYCEIDSFLPIREEFEFLRKSSYKKLSDGSEGFRLKTIKLRGQISQGLLLPLSVLEGPEEYVIGISEQPWGPQLQVGPYDDALVIEEGVDVTKELGIVKFEPPIPASLAGKVKGNFPSWGRKTDQERCQNLTKEINLAIQNEYLFEVTVKLDGSSMSIGNRDGEVVVCSRNLSLDLQQEGNTFIDVAKSLNILERIKEFGNIMISGELCGPGIQGNKESLSNHDFFVFDIFDVDKQEYMSSDERLGITNSLGLKHVPILHKLSSLSSIGLNSVDDILKYAEGPSLNSENREGLVFKKIDGSFSFKAISNSFLLGYD
jgi:RNA ligase (TIGR02306 family)